MFADIGRVTGHSYCVYEPLCIGTARIIFEDVPGCPVCERFWASLKQQDG